jgi:hypothetical protein
MRLVDGRHHAHLHHRLDDFVGLDGHAVGELADRDRLRDRTSRLTGAVGISNPPPRESTDRRVRGACGSASSS